MAHPRESLAPLRGSGDEHAAASIEYFEVLRVTWRGHRLTCKQRVRMID